MTFPPEKEIVDKYISIASQQAIDDGCSKITVISSDYDFIDIFRMLQIANPTKAIEFTLIAPSPSGRLDSLIQAGGSKYNQISIIRG